MFLNIFFYHPDHKDQGVHTQSTGQPPGGEARAAPDVHSLSFVESIMRATASSSSVNLTPVRVTLTSSTTPLLQSVLFVVVSCRDGDADERATQTNTATTNHEFQEAVGAKEHGRRHTVPQANDSSLTHARTPPHTRNDSRTTTQRARTHLLVLVANRVVPFEVRRRRSPFR